MKNAGETMTQLPISRERLDFLAKAYNLPETQKLAAFALSVIDAQPYGFTDGDRRGMIYEPRYADRLDTPIPVYRHAQPAPEYPEKLPCPVLLEPGMRFGKGVKTRLVLDAIQRRVEHYAELEAMTPKERAEHDANIEAFKAMLPQPATVAYSDFEGFWSAYTHPLAQDDELKEFAWDIWNACRAAMLEGDKK